VQSGSTQPTSSATSYHDASYYDPNAAATSSAGGGAVVATMYAVPMEDAPAAVTIVQVYGSAEDNAAGAVVVGTGSAICNGGVVPATAAAVPSTVGSVKYRPVYASNGRAPGVPTQPSLSPNFSMDGGAENDCTSYNNQPAPTVNSGAPSCVYSVPMEDDGGEGYLAVGDAPPAPAYITSTNV
jgi:hypothetical protein